MGAPGFERCYAYGESGKFDMVADTNSEIAWHRAQLKRHREALKALEVSRFTVGEMAGSKKTGQAEKTIAELQRKIAQSERCIAEYERRTRRPLTTDLQSLASVSWGSWNARSNGHR
jgi:uncharacterized coiled-coil protein SlyX